MFPSKKTACFFLNENRSMDLLVLKHELPHPFPRPWKNQIVPHSTVTRVFLCWVGQTGFGDMGKVKRGTHRETDLDRQEQWAHRTFMG